jgi:hypothetical protein
MFSSRRGVFLFRMRENGQRYKTNQAKLTKKVRHFLDAQLFVNV